MRTRSIAWAAFVAVSAFAAAGLAQGEGGEAPAVAAKDTTTVAQATARIGRPLGAPLVGDMLEHAVHDVSGLIRCPVCQGNSIADSPSEMANEMRAQVRELLAAGFTGEQIISYFESSYGEFVRLAPRAEGVTGFVWAGPVIAGVLGALAVAAVVRRLRAGGMAAPAPAGAAAPIDAVIADDELAEYRARVRKLVAGDGETRGAAPTPETRG